MHRQHFTGDNPGEESINAVGYWHRFTTCKLEPRSPGSQLRPILLAAENAFENPQAFPGPAVHIGRGAQWASQLSRSSRSGQARGCAGLQSAISTCAFATDPHVLVCISVDVEGAFVPPLTSSHGFQEARGRSPASNSHVWPRDPRVSVLRSISFLSKPRPPRVGGSRGGEKIAQFYPQRQLSGPDPAGALYLPLRKAPRGAGLLVGHRTVCWGVHPPCALRSADHSVCNPRPRGSAL